MMKAHCQSVAAVVDELIRELELGAHIESAEVDQQNLEGHPGSGGVVECLLFTWRALAEALEDLDGKDTAFRMLGECEAGARALEGEAAKHRPSGRLGMGKARCSGVENRRQRAELGSQPVDPGRLGQIGRLRRQHDVVEPIKDSKQVSQGEIGNMFENVKAEMLRRLLRGRWTSLKRSLRRSLRRNLRMCGCCRERNR